jgi:hypothetical protein
MTDIKKPTQCVNTEQAVNQIVQSHFNQLIQYVKVGLIRLAEWLVLLQF